MGKIRKLILLSNLMLNEAKHLLLGDNSVLLDNDTCSSKYLVLGFDDFRDSDFEVMMPLLDRYGFKATFNIINCGDKRNIIQSLKIRNCLSGGHEIGDHTLLHQCYPFCSPLFNGQDPDAPDGGQIPFPTNEELRDDRGDGRNVFGRILDSEVGISGCPELSGVMWKKLTDNDCQSIRNRFSLLRDKKLGSLYDTLSNRFLGTSGSSEGSWNGEFYEGGIFTGCRTSANHEVWERILDIQKEYYTKVYGRSIQFKTWSWPGSPDPALYFEKDGLFYFDRDFSALANDNGSLQSTYYVDVDGRYKKRSFAQCRSEKGYCTTNDVIYRGRYDGTVLKEGICKQYFKGASFTRKDCIESLKPDQSVVGSFSRELGGFVTQAYSRIIVKNKKKRVEKMYLMHKQGCPDFFDTIENIRHKIAWGILPGSLWDTTGNRDESVYWEGIFEFCKSVGITGITREMASTISNSTDNREENYILNPLFDNSAELFLPDIETPDNPDGYIGNCSVFSNESGRYLKVDGDTIYKRYGIPTGEGTIEFRCKARGNGAIKIFLIKNGSLPDCRSDEIADIKIRSANDFIEASCFFAVRNTVEWDECVIGLWFEYVGELNIMNPSLRLTDSDVCMEDQNDSQS